MKTEYKGFCISYDERTEKFTVESDELEYKSSSLSQVKKRIDLLQRKKFKRQSVFTDRSYWRGEDRGKVYAEGIATSVKEVPSLYGGSEKGYEIRIQFDGKRWEYQMIEKVYLRTVLNEKLRAKIEEKNSQINELMEEIKKLKSQLKHVKILDGQAG
jgi:hypothetical protein